MIELDCPNFISKEMKRQRVLCLLGIPCIFFVTLIVLSLHLRTGPESSASRIKLIAAHPHRFESRGERLINWEKLQKAHPQDVVYDPEHLAMLGQVHGKEDEDLKVKGDGLYAFNELISSRLSLNRAVPDTRHKLCQTVKYQHDLPKASIIICFYNEAWSTLLRTVHSILNRTPPELLHEIILVDDASELAHLQAKLAEYLWTLHPNITLVRLPDRQGLIRARLYGAHVATGEVLVFLDSHCEVNIKWLEPLLAKVAESKRTIAIPVIDMINSGTFEYKESSLVKGGFNWGMHYTWEHLPKDYFKDEESYIQPIETPTMAGGLFAVNRAYFKEKGEYDPGLDTWGGENLEISFRFWQCGGRLEIIPCSRVGHVFRQRRPYGSPEGGDSMLKNSVRVARVWMDDYIQYFFQVQPAAASVNYGNITARTELRKKLDCKPFKWYLRIIYPEQIIPDEQGQRPAIQNLPEKYRAKFKRGGPLLVEDRGLVLDVPRNNGKIKNKETGQCIVAEDEVPGKNSLLVLGSCDKTVQYKVWNETEDKELMLVYNLCLDARDGMGKVSYAKLGKCDGMKRSQAWVWTIKNFVYQLYNPTSGKCLAPVKDKDKFYLTLEICTLNNKMSAFKMEER